jgi:hypothetical protein
MTAPGDLLMLWVGYFLTSGVWLLRPATYIDGRWLFFRAIFKNKTIF